MLRGHDRFEEQGLWEKHYTGPDFCNDLMWMFAAQDAILEAGRVGPYLHYLMERLQPGWQDADNRSRAARCGFRWFTPRRCRGRMPRPTR